MNKIKIMTGQVWKILGKSESNTIEEVKQGIVFFTDGNWLGIEHFKDCEFIPQSDLDWLAVNNTEPLGEEITKQQWQDKRIELGLDEPLIDNTVDVYGPSKGFVKSSVDNFTKESKGEAEMKEDKDMIKIPVEWARKKGIDLFPGDIAHNDVYELYKIPKYYEINQYNLPQCNKEKASHIFITEFAERENTGVQPVGDDIPVYCFGENIDVTSNAAKRWIWDNIYDIESWKPNIEELNKMYLAEQENKESYLTKDDLLESANDHAKDLAHICDEYDRLIKFFKAGGASFIMGDESPVTASIRVVKKLMIDDIMKAELRDKTLIFGNLMNENDIGDDCLNQVDNGINVLNQIKHDRENTKLIEKLTDFMDSNDIVCCGESTIDAVIREISEKHDIDTRSDEQKDHDECV